MDPVVRPGRRPGGGRSGTAGLGLTLVIAGGGLIWVGAARPRTAKAPAERSEQVLAV